MPTAPNTLTDAPTSPDRSDRSTFTGRSIALDNWKKISNVPEMRVALAGVYANALEVYNSNPIAAAAAAAASAAAAATARDQALAGLGAADQSINLVQLAYGLAAAIDLAALAQRRIDDSRTYIVQTGEATVAQSASTEYTRTYASVAVTLPKAYLDAAYQVVVECVSAVPFLGCEGTVQVQSRTATGFVLAITGSATSAVLRWKTIHPNAK